MESRLRNRDSNRVMGFYVVVNLDDVVKCRMQIA
jgi:hypothetical protein